MMQGSLPQTVLPIETKFSEVASVVTEKSQKLEKTVKNQKWLFVYKKLGRSS